MISNCSTTYPNLDAPVAILGLGYVGIPLLFEIAKISTNRKIVGFDIDQNKIHEFNKNLNFNSYGYTKKDNIIFSSNDILFTSNPQDLSFCEIFIISVPTPVDSSNVPDLSCLKSATLTVLRSLSASEESRVLIYESTTYPGSTRSIYNESALNVDDEVSSSIKIGYSPERINPGKNTENLTSIVKITSGQDPETAVWIDTFYQSFIKAGTYMATSIEVAESAKCLENTQRDLNIALVNEMALICSRIGISVYDVINAASTKWNFMTFKPGLVGGHCIGVDPYYLAYKAESVGINPKLILAGRSVNDGMSGWIARRLLKKIVQRKGRGKTYSVLILGASFKEDCNDFRNSKPIEVGYILSSLGVDVKIYDPCIKFCPPKLLHSLDPIKTLNRVDHKFDAVAILVGHDEFHKLTLLEVKKLLNETGFIFDLKNIYNSFADPSLFKL